MKTWIPSLPPKKYDVAVLDPPWNESGGGKVVRGAQKHFPLLKTTEIINEVRASPAWQHVEENAIVYLWVTSNKLRDGLLVLEKLGVRFVTTMTWVKTEPEDRAEVERIFAFLRKMEAAGVDVDDLKLIAQTRDMLGRPAFTPCRKPGLGQRTRQEHELVLVGVRGKFPKPIPAARPRSVIYAPRGAHSEKPQAFYDAVEVAHPQAARVDIFARAVRPGFDAWGHLETEMWTTWATPDDGDRAIVLNFPTPTEESEEDDDEP